MAMLTARVATAGGGDDHNHSSIKAAMALIIYVMMDGGSAQVGGSRRLQCWRGIGQEGRGDLAGLREGRVEL
jgi:hypothetical protein